MDGPWQFPAEGDRAEVVSPIAPWEGWELTPMGSEALESGDR